MSLLWGARVRVETIRLLLVFLSCCPRARGGTKVEPLHCRLWPRRFLYRQPACLAISPSARQLSACSQPTRACQRGGHPCSSAADLKTSDPSPRVPTTSAGSSPSCTTAVTCSTLTPGQPRTDRTLASRAVFYDRRLETRDPGDPTLSVPFPAAHCLRTLFFFFPLRKTAKHAETKKKRDGTKCPL